MYWPRRGTVVILGFLGLLVTMGFRTAFALVMVYVLRENADNVVSIFKECTVNGTSSDLQLDWSVATSQYFNTAYFLGYVSTQLPGGFLAMVISPSKMFGGSVFMSSIFLLSLSIFMPLGTPVVFLIRSIQGILEGVNYSALNKVLSAWSPPNEKTRIVTTVYAGSYLAPAVAMLISGATTCYVSWHSSLFIYGSAGIAVSSLWLYLVRDSPQMNKSVSSDELSLFKTVPKHKGSTSIPWCSILKSLPVSAITVGTFCRQWVFAMIVTEVPQYFADAYGLNVSTIGFLAAFPPVLMTITILIGGAVVDKLISNDNISVTTGRKLSQSIGFGVEAICILCLGFVSDYKVAMVILCLGEGVSGFAIAGFKVNPLDLAPQYVSIITGLTRVSSIGSGLSTTVAGALREKNLSSWQNIFLIAGSLHMFGVIYYALFASGKVQSWARNDENMEITLIKPSAKENHYGSNGIKR